MAYLPVAQNTAWQQSTALDVEHTALLVIDVLGGAGGPTPGLEEMAANCVELVRAARAAGVPVVFCNDAHIPGVDRELELWGDHGIAGTDSAQPLAEFEAGQPGDFTIEKRRYDAFFGTSLDLLLRELGVTCVVACGCDTNICVLNTLASAYNLGYQSVVAADACGTFLVGTQEAGLEYFTKCFDSRVVTTATVLDLLNL